VPLRSSLVALLAAAVFAASFCILWAAQTGDAAGVLTNRKLIIPGIAADSVTQSSSGNAVVVFIDMSRNEPAVVGGGITTINVQASASGPVPAPGGPAVTASAYLSIGTHPGDECVWNIEGGSGSLSVTYSRPPSSPIRLTFGIANDISWYYMVQCKGATPIRFPKAPVDESFGGWLGLILPGIAGHGVTIDAPAVTDSSDVFFGKCRGKLENTTEFGTVTITVTVTDPSCKLPTPTPGPTQSPYEPGLP